MSGSFQTSHNQHTGVPVIRHTHAMSLDELLPGVRGTTIPSLARVTSHSVPRLLNSCPVPLGRPDLRGGNRAPVLRGWGRVGPFAEDHHVLLFASSTWVRGAAAASDSHRNWLR